MGLWLVPTGCRPDRSFSDPRSDTAPSSGAPASVVAYAPHTVSSKSYSDPCCWRHACAMIRCRGTLINSQVAA